MSDEEKIVVPSEEEVARYAGGADEPAPSATAETAGGAAAETPAPATPENDWKDIALRARAELSNYQKRAEKDRTEALRYANASLVKALLPVIDNLERLVQSGEGKAAHAKAMIEGAKLTLEQFVKTLREFNVEVIVAEGQPFDPQFHEAMMERPSDHAERVVLQEVAKGYKLHDRVIRPAKVIVSKPSEQETANAE